jgi:hypothetical protein
MKRSRAELRAGLLAQAEEVIDQLLDWHEATAAPTLAEIKDVVVKLRRRVSERMADAVVEDQESVQPVPGPACSGCGKEMRYKGMKEVTAEGRAVAVCTAGRATWEEKTPPSHIRAPGSQGMNRVRARR